MKIFITIAAIAVVGLAGAVLIAADKRKREPDDEDSFKCCAREKFRQLKEKFGCRCCKNSCDDENSDDDFDDFDLDGNDF